MSAALHRALTRASNDAANSAKRAFWALFGLAAGGLVLLIFCCCGRRHRWRAVCGFACQDGFSAVGGYLPANRTVASIGSDCHRRRSFRAFAGCSFWNTRPLVAAMQKRMTLLPAALDDRIGELGWPGTSPGDRPRRVYVHTGTAAAAGLAQHRIGGLAGRARTACGADPRTAPYSPARSP